MMLDEIDTMGDPHLGRIFKTGVPLHRRGDREELVWHQFEDELMLPHGTLHVNMGDLFHSYIVPPEVVLRAAWTYKRAAKRNRDVLYVVLEGNHDRAKDDEKRSSFDLFAELVSHEENIQIVSDKPWEYSGLGFVPYHPFRPTADLVAELPDDLEAVFGHWDIQDWGGDNVIPTKLMFEKGITLAYSGHDHLAREETRDGVEITVVGSLQPYTHAEDKTGHWYVTVSLPLEGCFKDKNVRVLLEEGETLPTDVDCLSIIGKRVGTDEKMEVDTSDFDSLDLSQLLANALGDLTIKDELMEVFNGA